MSKKELQPYQQKVIEEHDELSKRTFKLVNFITNNPIFDKLPRDEQVDLKIQYEAMRVYSNILKRRINRFTNN